MEFHKAGNDGIKMSSALEKHSSRKLRQRAQEIAPITALRNDQTRYCGILVVTNLHSPALQKKME
jgi:hypothetical protein